MLEFNIMFKFAKPFDLLMHFVAASAELLFFVAE
jgi:hypothetical protein